MDLFEVKDEFYLNHEKIKIISGAVHYFRIVPEYWRDRLIKLKNMGCNCVETYVPWNFHEPKKGKFEFQGRKDVVRFIKIAKELGLLVILRPSPYICAEWEFGGLPSWLLKDNNIRIRSKTKEFLEAVDLYYQELFSHVKNLQVTYGGPIIMMQVENEYGSFGNDKTYISAIKNLMIKHGVNVPLFTSDGGWKDALEAGSNVEEGILPTVNFGSRTEEQMGALQEFMEDKSLVGPHMCMEFWIGWFDNWGGEWKERDAEDAAQELDKILSRGSVNIYMLHGGTNFGFYNGCSYHQGIDPQVTSYDYDAPISEWGEETEKYRLFKKVISKYKVNKHEEKVEVIPIKNLGKVELNRKVSLFSTLDEIVKPIYNSYTLNMEKLDQSYGYILYQSDLGGKREFEKARLVDCDDRAQVYINEEWVATQYKESMGENIQLKLEKSEKNRVDILVENMGRINYGAPLVLPSQRKGLKGGFMVDIHFQSGWKHYCLDFEDISRINFEGDYKDNTPSFYEYCFSLNELVDTFLDMSKFGKGCVFINGKNIGRFWSEGPINTLYIPAPLLIKGDNTIIIFETEGIYSNEITFTDHPVIEKNKESV